MLHLLPAAEDTAVLAVKFGQRAHVLARELRVVVHEGLLAFDAELLEQIPQLHHISQRTALVVGVVGQVAVQGFVGFVEKLVKTAHRGVAGVLSHPGLDLLENGKVAGVHLGVGLVPQRPDQHAAKGVQVQPHHDVRVLGCKVEHGACFRCTAGVGAGAGLLRLWGPGVREVAVEVVGVVAQEVRLGNGAAVEIGNAPFGIELEVRANVLRQARHHHRGHQRRAVVAAQFNQFTVGVCFAHVADEAVAVDVLGNPACMALMDAVVHGARPHVAATLEHFFGTIGRDARHDVEQRLANGLRHVRGQGLAARFVGALMDGEDVFGDGQRHAGAADFAGVHVAVDPDGRALLPRVAADGQQRDVAA